MTKEAAPLQIIPLLDYKQPEVTVGHYEVVQRIVTPSPHPNKEDAEIETSVEIFISPEGNAAWRRVAVRSGPVNPEQDIHASFMLPDQRQNLAAKSSIVCWAAFPEHPDYKLLCVLANATTLCIFDVYPRGKAYTLGGEGHTIPLPFEACGVYAIEDGQGLLLQRTETLEDNLAFDALNRTWTSTGLQGDEEDDGFVLKAPPRPLRFRESTGTEFGSLHMSKNPTTVPSLFSLSHPLDDILPVSNLVDPDSQNLPFEDVFEKILFVVVVRWVDTTVAAAERKEQVQPICVTYHTHKKRHAIWEIKNSPPPPPQPPLWEVSSQWRSSEGVDSHLGVLQQDLDDMVLLDPPHDPNASRYDAVARKEALADALGVRKTPHKVGEQMGPRARVLPSRSTNRPRAQKPSANSLSLLSPLSKPTNETLMDVDTTMETTSRPPLLNIGPFASLHPKIAMACIYEDKDISPEASNIFLISNEEGSGTLTLCMVRPREDSSNPNEVVLFSLESVSKDTPVLNGEVGQFEVVPKTSIPCVAAAPLESSPIPCCFLAHEKKRLDCIRQAATDMLLLHNDDQGQRKLRLCRNSMPIVDCALPEKSRFSSGTVEDICCSVGNRIDLIIAFGSSEPVCLRTRISLQMATNAICEKVIQAVEATLASAQFRESSSKGVEVALKLRADCVRMHRSLLQISDKSTFIDGDLACKAVGSVLCAMLVLELLGRDVNDTSAPSMDSSSPDMSAWEMLLSSEYHREYSSAECPRLAPPITTPASTLAGEWRWNDLGELHSLAVECLKSDTASFAAAVFDSMHAVYEDFKLYGSARDEGMRFVGSILCQVCTLCPTSVEVPRGLFLAHYRRDLGKEVFERAIAVSNGDQDSGDRPKATQLSSRSHPPCILSWIDARVSFKNVDCGYELVPQESAINATCTRTRSVVRIFNLLYSDCEDSRAGRCERDRRVAIALIQEGFADRTVLRDQLPTGVVVPLLEVLFRCRDEKELLDLAIVDPEMWSLIGRDDVYKNSQGAGPGFSAVSSYKDDLLSSLDASDESKQHSSKLDDKDKDGISPLEVTSSMLFPEDNRIREVGKLLRSSRPMYLNVPRAIEVTDHDYERMKQEKLLLLSRRALALPVGRGMFTIGNLQPVPAEPLPLPEISLVGRVPPTNAMLALDTSELPNTDMKVWPDFHNGVAAGLRLPLHMDSNDSISKITRTWIVYNRPNENASQSQNNQNNGQNANQPNPIHGYGGLLMALGLRGHLTALEMTDIFDYLTQGTVTTTVGVLLGMAVNMRGSCDVSVSKMLCLHIPSLIPQHFSAIDVASTVQAAAIAGAGLLYQGSSHRMMTEFLLNEIGKRPTNDLNVIDREAYTLSCGIALGMVNLCRGEGTNSDGARIGSAGLSDLRIEDRLYRYIVGGQDDAEIRRQREESDRLSLPSASAANGNEKCSCIFEGNSINTHVTAPGAILALGLMYMMTGNTTIASAIALPDTHFLLEYVRPDFLMLRVISRALILWNDVKPTKAWIDSQLPKAAAEGYKKMREVAKNMSQPSAVSSPKSEDKSFDRQAVRLIYVHVIAGACFAIGLRFAGTGNRDAAAAIFERVMELRDLRDGSDAVSCALRPPVPVLEMCLGCAAISLSMVMAGSGDLEVLRLLKVLRWRCDEELNYGSHLAFGTAIGLLFLGGGTCTLGREPEDIAALVMAFYPRFPSSSTDNQYHLQALRNLYAIAVKERSFRAIDVDTGESVFVPLQVHFEDSSVPPLKMTAPCLFFNTDAKPKELRVDSERYYPLTLSMNEGVPRNTIFVKRRSAHLSYLQDPHSQRSLLVQTGTFQGSKALDLIASFTDDQKVLAFAKHFCDLGQPARSGKIDPFSIAGFCSRVLHESLLLDTEEALPLYLALRTTISSLQAGFFAVATQIWDFRIIKSYYEQRHQLQLPDSSPRLLNSEIVAYLLELLEKLLSGSGVTTQLESSARSASQQDGSVPIYFDSTVHPLEISSLNMDLS